MGACGVKFAGLSIYPVGPGQKNIVRIEYTGTRPRDFKAANQAAGIGNTQKPPKGFTWHHLDEIGLPTVNARKITVDNQPALLFDRFAQGSKDVVRLSRGKIRNVGQSFLLNQRSVADLRTIRQTMVNKNIKINDLQFLIGRDGRVVVADPLGWSHAAPSRNNLRMIDLLIRAAGGQ